MDKYSEEILDRFSDLLNFDTLFLPEKIICRRVNKKPYLTPYGNFLKCNYKVRVFDEVYEIWKEFDVSVLIKLAKNETKDLPSLHIYLPKEGKKFKKRIINEIVLRMKEYKTRSKIKVEDSEINPFLSTQDGEYILIEYEIF